MYNRPHLSGSCGGPKFETNIKREILYHNLRLITIDVEFEDYIFNIKLLEDCISCTNTRLVYFKKLQLSISFLNNDLLLNNRHSL